MNRYTISRRGFIKAGGASLFLSAIPVNGFTKNKPPGNISIIILEGGLDGLAAVPPLGDPDLFKMRKKLIPTKKINLNPFFGIHPALINFTDMLAQNNAAIVHATSFPYVKRSHFEGQNLVQGGGLSPFSIKTGWLGRALDHALLAGRSLSLDMPLILRGSQDIDNFYPAHVKGSKRLDTNLVKLIAGAHNNYESYYFNKIISKLNDKSSRNVPRDPYSLALYAGMQLAKENGPVVSVLKVNGFDTHARQGSDNGSLANQLAIYDEVIGAYREGLGKSWNNSIILTLTEFGRTVKVNGGEGSDHGYGTAGLLVGGMIKKARVVADWPGLSTKDQFEKRDLMSTIDYRSVCAACIEKALALDHDIIANKVFMTPTLPRVYEYLFS